MPRLCRRHLVDQDSTNHCTWRTHNLEFLLNEPGARERYRALLRKYKSKYGIQMRSYCLMGSHPHVTCKSTKGQKEFSGFWKVVNQCFARWSNKQMGRRGQVVMERLRSPMIQDGAHLLRVMRYGDLNPVRAGIVRSPKDWKWSSYRHYAFGEPDDLIDDPPEYLALGATPVARRRAYQQLFADKLSETLLEQRPELVVTPFVGDEAWCRERLAHCGLSPPRLRA